MTAIDFTRRRFDDDEQRAVRRLAERGELQRVRPGAYRPRDEEARWSPEGEHRALIEATVPRIAAGSVVSHVSAAVLHDLPVRWQRLDRVHVVRASLNGRRSKFLHAHRAELGDGEVEMVSGVAVTSLSRTVRDLATTLPFGEALAIADAALRRGHARDRLAEAPSMTARVRRVLELGDGRSESILESMSRAVMIRARLPMPELQFVVRDSSGREVARSDFAWPEWRLVGEADGDVKYGGSLGGARSPAEAIRAEKHREESIRECAFGVVRWGWDLAMHPERLTARILGELRRRGYTGGHSLPARG